MNVRNVVFGAAWVAMTVAAGAASATARAADAPALITCTDGYVMKGGQGACGGHGGIDKKAAPLPAGSTAKCKDGTFSSSKTASGTCSGHGGVSQRLDGK